MMTSLEFNRYERLVQAGDLPALEMAVLSGVDLREPAPFTGRTLLHTAAQHGKIHIASFLLDAGMNIDVADDLGVTPLIEAVAARQVHAVDFLCMRGADTDKKYMLRHDALMVAKSAFPVEKEIVERLLLPKGKKERLKEFAKAAADGRVDIMSIFFDKMGFAPDTPVGKQGVTALIIASERHRLAMVDYLLGRGADPNAADCSLGVTPLIAASQNPCLRDLPVFESLLRANADPEKPCLNGRNFLEHAEMNDIDPDVVTRLREMVLQFKNDKPQHGISESVPQIIKKIGTGKRWRL